MSRRDPRRTEVGSFPIFAVSGVVSAGFGVERGDGRIPPSSMLSTSTLPEGKSASSSGQYG
jgi:hypothetical protein